METLWSLYENQIVFRPRWIERYFPGIAERHRVEYSDIEFMSEDQAQATRHLLVQQIVYFESRMRKQRARTISLVPEDKDGAEDQGDFRIRATLYEEALHDICEAFRFSNPVSKTR